MKININYPVILLFLLLSCKSRVYTSDTPEGAIRLFISAWDENSPEKVFKLLAEESRKKLKERAEALNRKGIKIKPWELLVTPRFNYHDGDYRIIIKGMDSGEARKKVKSVKAIIKSKAGEDSFLLKKEGNQWKVVLPY